MTINYIKVLIKFMKFDHKISTVCSKYYYLNEYLNKFKEFIVTKCDSAIKIKMHKSNI